MALAAVLLLPLPAAAGEDDAAARLHSLPGVSEGEGRPAWEILDARGRALDAPAFARLVGDEAMLARLDAERRRAAAMRRVLAVGGLGLLLASGVSLASLGEVAPPNPEAYEVDPADYPAEEDLLDARAAATADWEAALHAARVDRAWASLALAVSGSAALLGVPLVERGLRARQALPALYWSRSEAERLLRDAASGESGGTAPGLSLELGPGGVRLRGTFR